MEEVYKVLRSCLLSCKGGIKFNNLKADYYLVAGEHLPFKKYGYPTIEAFIHNMPNVTVTTRNGELYVEAGASKTTAHLEKLISRQRARRKPRPQPKRWQLPRQKTRSYNFRNNEPHNFTRKPSQDSFTRSTPGRSNLYTDFNRPVPLMETIVQFPFPEKPKFTAYAPQSYLSERLKEKATDLSALTLNQKATDLSALTLNQSINESKPTKNFQVEIVNERLKTPDTSSTNIYNNSQPVAPQAQIVENVSLLAPDPRKELEVRANALDLPSPIYVTYIRTYKGSLKKEIYANVKIGVHTFNIYPEFANSKEEAEKMAARLALMNLEKEFSSPQVTMTVDAKLIEERILDIITNHDGGVFMHRLPVYYSEQYGEVLSDEWQRIIERCPIIRKEKNAGNSTILVRAVVPLKPDIQSPSKEIYSEINSSFNEKILLSPIGPAVPGKFKIPELAFWNVYTTCIVNTTEIWVRLIDEDYNDKFIKMMSDMIEYYDQLKEPIAKTACIVGDFYAIFEDNNWHRVQCIDFDLDTGNAMVHFIDEGYEDEYNCELLHPLDKRFCDLQAQAIRVALHGLEDFCDYTEIIAELESHLLDQVFCVKVHSTDTEKSGSHITVTFYDTTGKDDIDVNLLLLDKILDSMTPSSKVHIGQLIEIYVTHVEEQGRVYAQLNTPVKTYVLSLLNDTNMSKIPLSVMKNSLVGMIDFTKTYFVTLGSRWYRARVIDICDKYEAKVFLIDFGRTIKVRRGDLLHMDKILRVLQNIPPQATPIFLHNVDQSMYGEKFVTRFNELVSDTDLLLAKVVKVTMSGIPIVEIFKRIGPNNMLASINTSLIYDEELMRSNEDGNNNIKPKKRLERRSSHIIESSGKLNPPAISDIGQYFDVHVALASHPGHFIIQPFKDNNNLKNMMVALKKCYDAYEGPQLESVSEGKLYAGKYKDNCWYRVYVTDIIDDIQVSVYLCDYGDITVVQQSSLQPLKSEFLELPYQAVKAKLVGIQPLNKDWSVEDSMRFQELVCGKDFVSVVVESTIDTYSPANDTVLGLQLIDVSTEKDIFIHMILVEEKRAKLSEQKTLLSS